MVMAVDVRSLLRLLNVYKEEQLKIEAGKSKVLITRDLLGGGGSSKLGSKELDLDMQVPSGWENQLDMKSGKVYLQRCNLGISSPSLASDHNKHQGQKQQLSRTVPELQDLNFPPTTTTSSNFLDETGLELKLVPSYYYQSVCTLDKVKSALERAERGSGTKRSRSIDGSTSPTPTSSIKEAEAEGEEQEDKTLPSALLFAAGCPACLLYVLISKRNPKCPRCYSIVPSPLLKKPRIDLNATV